MPLSPHLEALIAQIAPGAPKPFHQLEVGEARVAFEGYAALAGPAPEMMTEDVFLPLQDGDVHLRMFTPDGTPRAVLVYLHGGGWVVGSVEGFSQVARQMAAATGAIVMLVGYRLAPEHPFPIPVQDCWAATQWAAARFDLPLVVVGDSAGGNLAAAVTLLARDSGSLHLAGQVLIYPVTDCDFSRPAYGDSSNHVMLAPRDLAWFWHHYVPKPADRSDPLASPLRAAAHSGLPPALILTAEYDVLRDEGEAYAARLSAAGVPVQLERFAGQAHGFFVLGGALPESADAMATVARYLDRIL